MARHLPVVLALLVAMSPVLGCNPSPEPTRPLAVLPSPTMAATPTLPTTPTLPATWTPRAPTPTNTRVVPIPPTSTPGPSPTPTRLQARTKAFVIEVQDGRTIGVLLEGQPLSQVFTVRLLGIQPPLLSNPWSTVAAEWLASELGRQVVLLESDERERDGQGNLLRYVWAEGRMVNVTMVQLGLASAAEDAATLRYGADLLEAEADARQAKRGMWGPPPTPTPTGIATTPLTTTEPPTVTLEATAPPPLETPTVRATALVTPTANRTLTPTSSP